MDISGEKVLVDREVSAEFKKTVFGTNEIDAVWGVVEIGVFEEGLPERLELDWSLTWALWWDLGSSFFLD